MMRILFVFIFFQLISFAALAQGIQTLSLSEAFLPSGAKTNKSDTLALLFKVPKVFGKRYLPELQTTLWGTKEDIDTAIKTKRLKKSKHGIFSLKVSLNVRYDENSKKFTNKDDMANVKNLSVFSDVTFSRNDNNGFPTATLTAKAGNQHIFILYVALGSAALKIDYYPAKHFSKKDGEAFR